VTPPLASGVLGGVTRDLVLRVARRAGLPVREEPCSVARLRAADEAFVTSSTVEILPLIGLDGRRLGGGRPGPITRSLQERYRAAVATAIRRARVAGSRST
jgi:branched-subunit amino acid aminotransferase/4-amino-4-deoxychorismate lyase